MPVFEGSRYEDNAVCAITDDTGTTRQTIMHRGPVRRVYQFSWYTWKDSDRVDLLAWSLYGSELDWWRIADANPEILWWDDLPPGTQVRIPNGTAG